MISKTLLEASIQDRCGRADAYAALPRLSWGWAAVVVVAIVYGSLIPFDSASSLGGRSLFLSIEGLRFVVAPLSDRLLNILIFVPVGFLLVMCRSARGRVTRGAMMAVASGLVMSVVIEATQTCVVSRVASWYDVILNLTGVAIGVWIAILSRLCGPRLVELASHRLGSQLFGAIAVVVALGLLVYELFPFDFVASTESLFAAFRRARWDVLSVRHVPTGAPPFEAITAQFAGAGWFAVLGYVSALANRERGRRPGVSFCSAVKHGILLACLIEGMQLLTNSHVFDLASVALRLLATVLGAWAAMFVVDELSGGHWRKRPEAAAPCLLLAMILAFQLALLAAASLGFGQWSLANVAVENVSWMPFRSLWEQTSISAVGTGLSILFWYGSLSLVLTLLFHRARIQRSWALVTTTVFFVAVAMEAIKAGSVGRTADSTDVVLAVAAAIVTCRMYLAFARIKHLVSVPPQSHAR